MSVRILEGDALQVLQTLPDCSVQCCVTSPPYWGAQRDYGMPGQLGMERTPELFVAALVGVFVEVRRVLRDDGVLWLNIGDSYAASGKGGGGSAMKKRGDAWGHRERMKGWRGAPPGYKNKDIVGVPWLLAFALRSSGWYLRRDVVWAKPTSNEPTRADRPVGAHEMLFLLSKSEDYSFTLPEKQMTSVWRVSSDGAHGGVHFATMPAGLIEPCIRSGSKEGDTILDPFSGAGTTALVADRLGRDAIGIELNPEYAALSKNRIHSDNPLFGDVA